MINKIIGKINKEGQIEARDLINELKISHVLLEYLLRGMEKKRYIKSVICEKCEFKNICPKDRKFCKGFGKYWFLTSKGINKLR
jgi:hypothetical protein